MASVITATNSSGLTTSADNSGVLQLASGTGNLVTIPSVTGTAMVSGNMPAFSAYANGGQSISTVTWTKIQFNVKNFDTNTNYDNATNYRFTPTVAGYYQINTVLTFGGGANGFNALCSIYKNGSAYSYGSLSTPNSNSYGAGSVASAVIYFNGSTDYVEVYGYQSSGLTLNMQAGNINCQFSGSMVRVA